jgi:S1-C subfamily serine protease
VWTDGPASKAGLKLGDIITGLNGVNVSQGDFEGQIARYKPGSRIRVGYMRNAWAFETKLTLSRMPM